jgi:K+/H+ antiporter YhaU regulatory subunit KhtT
MGIDYLKLKEYLLSKYNKKVALKKYKERLQNRYMSITLSREFNESMSDYLGRNPEHKKEFEDIEKEIDEVNKEIEINLKMID